MILNLAADRLEWLALPGFSRSWAIQATAPEGGSGARITSPPADEDAGPSVQALSTGVVTIEISREQLHRYTSNLPEVLTSALATPRYAAGSMGPAVVEGYELSRVKPGGIVDRLGLANGDVLLEYNGQALDSLTTVTTLFGQVQSLSGARLTVLRDGRKLSFVLRVR